MLPTFRKAAVSLLALTLAVGLPAASLADYSYFRLGPRAGEAPPAPAISYRVDGNAYALVGQQYVASSTVAGAEAPVVFSLVSGSLPPGLSMDTSTGAITGNPDTLGISDNLQILATDARGRTALSPKFSIAVTTVAPPAPQADPVTVTGSASSGSEGYGYSAQFTAAGGAGGAYSYQVLGPLPSGLAIDGSGRISGTLSAGSAGNHDNLTVRATDSLGATGDSAPFSIYVLPASATAALLTATPMRSGSFVLGSLSSSFVSPTWSFVSTPAWAAAALSGSGSIFFGTAPTVSVPTMYSVTARATGNGVTVAAQAFSMSVLPALTLSGGPSGTVSGSQGAVLNATAPPVPAGLIGTASYSLLQFGAPADIDALCPGLVFASGSGRLSGTPAGGCQVDTLSLLVTDSSDGATAETPGIFSVGIAGDFATATLANGSLIRQGQAVAGALVTNLASPTWTFASTPALTLSSDAVSFFGTAPAVSVPTAFSIVATSRSGATSQTAAAMGFTVVPPLAASGGPAGTVTGSVGASVSFPAVAVSNLIGAPTFAVRQAGATVSIAALCPGLALDGVGRIQGTPTAACSPTGLTIRATDGYDGTSASTATFAVSMTVPVPTSSSAVLTTPATVRQGQAVAGTLASSLASPTWTFSSTPALAVAATGSGFSATAPVVTVPTTFTVTATATASAGTASSAPPFSFTAMPPPVLNGGPSGTAVGYVGTQMSLAAPSALYLIGTPTYSVLRNGSVVAVGTYCSGLSVSATTGILSGAPTATCTQTGWTFRVTDSHDGAAATTAAAFGITVAAAPGSVPPTPGGAPSASVQLASGFSLSPYSNSGTGGVKPYRHALADGALPPGITLSDAGLLSGYPTLQGSFSFSVRLIDAAGIPGAAGPTGTIAVGPPAPMVWRGANTAPLGSVMGNGVFVEGGNITFDGGVAPFTMSFIGGPPGLETIGSSTIYMWGSTRLTGTGHRSMDVYYPNLKLRVTDSRGTVLDTVPISTTLRTFPANGLVGDNSSPELCRQAKPDMDTDGSQWNCNFAITMSPASGYAQVNYRSIRWMKSTVGVIGAATGTADISAWYWDEVSAWVPIGSGTNTMASGGLYAKSLLFKVNSGTVTARFGGL